MTFAELYAMIADKVHRKDMTARIPGFVETARTMLNMRLGLELGTPVAPTDTNETLTEWPLLYFYAAMAAQYEFIEEFETASYYDGKWEREADRYYITRAGTVPLVITVPEEEQQP